jgi:mannose-1-phosphate guanylyltransferase
MMHRPAIWSIVLAGGDGTRLGPLTTTSDGSMVPKQFCSLFGTGTLLELSLLRAERLAPLERILVAVSERHRAWWLDDLGRLPPPNIISQPENRGTLIGLLLPLLEVVNRDPAATVVVFPSDHFVADDVVLETAARQALAAIDGHPEAVILLGMRPESRDPSYGWVVPLGGPTGAVMPVSSFIEKPDSEEAGRLFDDGALRNSFILVARAARLVELCEEHVPGMLWALRLCRWDGGGPPSCTLEEVYASLPAVDFSSTVMQRAAHRLLVLEVPPCGWCDLGTPDRVAQLLARGRPEDRSVRLPASHRPVLAAALPMMLHQDRSAFRREISPRS